MSRYFSKLAKRTGLTAKRAEKLHPQTVQVDRPPAFQPKKGALLKRGLEADIGKIVEPDGQHGNSESENSLNQDSTPGLQSSGEKHGFTSDRNTSPDESEVSVKGRAPSHWLKADSVKKDRNDNAAPGFPNFHAKTVRTSIPQPGIRSEKDQHKKGTAEAENRTHPASPETTAARNDDPDNALLMDKQQYTANPKNRAPGQNHFNKTELTNRLSRSKSERQPIGEEKTISPGSESRQTGESGDDSFLTMPYTRTKETPSSSPATIGSGETTAPFRGTRTTPIVSKSGRVAETKLKQAKSAAQGNSIDIRIGTISFEVYQAPAKKSVTDHPAAVPRAVVKRQTSSPKTPRLSRYYLRGL